MLSVSLCATVRYSDTESSLGPSPSTNNGHSLSFSDWPATDPGFINVHLVMYIKNKEELNRRCGEDGQFTGLDVNFSRTLSNLVTECDHLVTVWSVVAVGTKNVSNN